MLLKFNEQFKCNLPFWTLNQNDSVLILKESKESSTVLLELPIHEDLAFKLKQTNGQTCTLKTVLNAGNSSSEIPVYLISRKSTENTWEGFICEQSNTLALVSKLVENNAFIETVLDEVNSLVLIIDEQGYILKVSKYLEELSGLSESFLIGKHAQTIFMPEHEAKASLSNIAAMYKENDAKEAVRECLVKGQIKHIHWRNVLINDWSSSKKYLICAGTDITAQVMANKELDRLSKTDSLTGLWNRSALENHVNSLIANQDPFSILFLDFNNFKMVNDTLGHYTGDELLSAFSNTVSNSNLFSFTSRIGGDEFVLISKTTDIEKLNLLMADLYGLFSKPLIPSKNLSVKFSTGVSRFPEHGQTYADLFRRADMAMYKAKEKRQNEFYVYEESLEQKAIKLKWLEDNTPLAIDNDEFFILLQPKYNTNTKLIESAEALVRWKSSVRGSMVFPDEFIPFAEQNGVINGISSVVLKKVCESIKKLTEIGCAIPIAINVSPKQLDSNKFILEIKESLKLFNIPPELLHVEITESCAATNAVFVNALLTELKQIGIQVHLDDFGKGQSSLALLDTLDIDVIKLDKCLVDKISKEKGQKLIYGMLTLAKTLGLKTVVEGVETAEQYELVKEMGTDVIQGYYFSRPIPFEELKSKLIAQKEESSSIVESMVAVIFN